MRTLRLTTGLACALALAACVHQGPVVTSRWEAPLTAGGTFALVPLGDSETAAERAAAAELTRLGLRRVDAGATPDYRISVSLGRRPTPVGAFVPPEGEGETLEESAWRVRGAPPRPWGFLRRGGYQVGVHITGADGREVYVGAASTYYLRDRPETIVPRLVAAAIAPLRTPPAPATGIPG